MITLLGLLTTFTAFVLVAYYHCDLASPVPAWVYYWAGLAMWIFTSFDAVDGKQARRTGQSSPLGELFDHGCDAINMVLMTVIAQAVYRLEVGWNTVALLMVALTTFYITAWEEYHTRILYIGHISGPIEGVTALIISSFVSGYCGTEVWDSKIGSLLPVVGGWVADAELRSVSIVFMILVAFATSCISVKHVLPYSGWSSLVQLIPFTVFCACSCIWLHFQPALWVGVNHFYFLLLAGAGFADATSCVITAHVTRADYPYFTVPCMLTVFRVLVEFPVRLGGSIRISEAVDIGYVKFSLVLALVLYSIRSYNTVRQMCDYLDINCLSIKSKRA